MFSAELQILAEATQVRMPCLLGRTAPGQVWQPRACMSAPFAETGVAPLPGSLPAARVSAAAPKSPVAGGYGPPPGLLGILGKIF